MPCCHSALQDYIGRLTHEKGDLDKRFHGMKDELIARLQNACAQRDEARGQVLELQNALGRLEQDLAARDKQLAAMQAALAGQGPAPLAPSSVVASGALPSALANGAIAATPEARRMGTPGYAKSIMDNASNFMAGGAPGECCRAMIRQQQGVHTKLRALVLQRLCLAWHRLQQRHLQSTCLRISCGI